MFTVMEDSISVRFGQMLLPMLRLQLVGNRYTSLDTRHDPIRDCDAEGALFGVNPEAA